MNIGHYVAWFWGGAFLMNAVPHVVAGAMGRAFQSPFAKPPGEGLSSSTVNVLWGFFNAVVAWVLLVRVEGFDLLREGLGRHGLEHLLHGELGRIGAERGDCEGTATCGQQHGGNGRRDLLRIRPKCVGHARSNQLLGGKNAVDQTSNSNSGTANPRCGGRVVRAAGRCEK